MEKIRSMEEREVASGMSASEMHKEPEGYEHARGLLSLLDDEDLSERILAYPELNIFLNEVADKEGVLDSTVYEKIRKTDSKLASKFLIALHDKCPLPETHLKMVVGNLSAPEKEEAMLMHRLFLEKRRKRELDASEREKTELELGVIARSEENINLLRSRFNLPPLHFPPERVAMKSTTKSDIGGEDKPATQETYIYETTTGLSRFATIHHELLHAADYQSMQAYNIDGKIVAGSFRGGLTFWNTVQNAAEMGVLARRHLDPLNEAVKEEWSRRFVLALREDDPLLGTYVRNRNEELSEFGDEVKISPDEYYGYNPNENGLKYVLASYPKERQAMWALFNVIYEQNRADFPGMTAYDAKETLLDLVTKSSFTGDLVALGRIIEKTFGLGSFRRYCECRTADEVFNFLSDAKKHN